MRDLIRDVDSQQAAGHVDWDAVAARAGKERLACMKKYLKTVNFATSDSERYHEWTDVEKQILMTLVDKYGKNWRLLARFFTWMTPLKLKNKHYALTKAQTTRTAPKPIDDELYRQLCNIL